MFWTEKNWSRADVFTAGCTCSPISENTVCVKRNKEKDLTTKRATDTNDNNNNNNDDDNQNICAFVCNSIFFDCKGAILHLASVDK